jgi:AmiR/NasT family two-component response regulator
VLVAEDEVLIRLDLVEMLTEEGYDVVGAEKGVALQDPPMVSMLLGWSLYRRGRR